VEGGQLLETETDFTLKASRGRVRMYPRGSSISCRHYRQGQELRQFPSAAGLLCMFTDASLLQPRTQWQLSHPGVCTGYPATPQRDKSTAAMQFFQQYRRETMEKNEVPENLKPPVHPQQKKQAGAEWSFFPPNRIISRTFSTWKRFWQHHGWYCCVERM